MVRAGCASTTCAPPPRSFVLTASRWQNPRNATPTRHSFTLTTRQRQGRRASSTPHCEFLIGSRQLLEIDLTHSQQMRKHFLTGGFSPVSQNSCLVKPSPCRSRRSLQLGDRAPAADDRSSEPQSPQHRGSLTVVRRSSRLLVSTVRWIRRSALVRINSEGEDRCRNALFSRMCGVAIKNTGFASA
jgi:hypothetical protein